MDHLWTPWRYAYITGAETAEARADARPVRKGVPPALAAWPGPEAGAEPDPANALAAGCVFCNLIGSVRWAIAQGMATAEAERAGFIIARLPTLFVCLNAYPYSSGHLLLVPYRHTDSLASLPAGEAEELMRTTQTAERSLRAVYAPDGINLGMNLGAAAGAGVAGHLHLHALPRWFGDTNFMTATAETRILPEALEITWERVRKALAEGSQPAQNAPFTQQPAR